MNPLTTAINISKEGGILHDFTWGERYSRKKKTIPCSEFVRVVIEEHTGMKLNSSAKRRINIVPNEGDNLDVAVEDGHDWIKGVALVIPAVGLGTTVSPKDAEPGDFVQYWKKRRRSGKWAGHTGVINDLDESSNNLNARLYGIHQSIDRIDVSRFWFRIEKSPSHRVYIARLNR
jgi:hypothetical protein